MLLGVSFQAAELKSPVAIRSSASTRCTTSSARRASPACRTACRTRFRSRPRTRPASSGGSPTSGRPSAPRAGRGTACAPTSRRQRRPRRSAGAEARWPSEFGLDGDEAEAVWTCAAPRRRGCARCATTRSRSGVFGAPLLHRRRRAVLGQRPAGADRALAARRLLPGRRRTASSDGTPRLPAHPGARQPARQPPAASRHARASRARSTWRPRTSFFPSLAETLEHILAVDLYYLAALHGEADMERHWDEAPKRETLAALAAAQAASDQRFIDHVGGARRGGARRHRRDGPRRAAGSSATGAATSSPTCSTTRCTTAARRTRCSPAPRSQPPQLDEFLMPSEAHLRTDDLRALGWTEATLFALTAARGPGWRASTSRPSTSCCATRSPASSPARSSRTRCLGRRRHDAARGAAEARRRRPARPDVRRASTAAARPTRSTNLVFAEALSQSTFGGFIITVLVHTDMASPHLHHAGSAAQKARCMPGDHGGDDDHRGRDHRARRRVGCRRHPHDGDALGRRQRVDPQRHQALHHQRRPRRPVLRRRPHRRGPACDVDVHRREGHAGLSRRPRARQERLALVRHRRAGVRGLPHPGRATCSARRTAASTR